MLDPQEIYRVEDEFGLISVFDDKECRTLSFGLNDEQSKLLKLSPHIPQHTYVQAMLLVLLFCQPRSAIVLGLGGGGLVHALRHYDASMKLTAVELSAKVIEISKRFFQLSIGKKLNVENVDATEFLRKGAHKKVNVIFADIYNVDGVIEQQLSEQFINDAHGLLKEDGYLVLNCWKEQKFNQALLQYLQAHFAEVRACLTGGGNWVVFAAKKPKAIAGSELKNRATQLSNKLGFPLSKHLNRFDVWESAR
ncbi:spermidine synthase [Shewanella gelidii]|uniref:Spermidine synthase n=1 Tax=Shewanella gelidii TaxID=1642821 RepID=A0A917K154_9GAMM|nr:methyltransferase [Shewanella gelidii]MCL1099351.1 methyltransferase [Shewanella gelidii]GGI92221.1 spermidine synthase [Shewanella gelidii]